MSHRKSTCAAGIAVVAACVLTSCTGGDAGSGGENTEVNILGYAALFEDKYTEAVIEQFETEHPDITVNFVPAQNSAEMIGKLRSEASNPTIDVAILDQSVAHTGNQEGLFSKIEEESVPNLANVVDLGRDVDGYGPAVTFDNLVLLYNPELVSDAPTTVEDLWSAPNRSIAIPAPPDIQGIALTVLVAENLGGDYQTDVGPAIEKLSELAPQVSTWEPQPDVYQTVTSGSTSYAIGWNARGQVYSEESEGRLEVVQPEDGVAFQINTINAVEGSANGEAALEFIDFALSSEAQQSFAEAMYYTPTVSNVEIPEELDGRIASPEDELIVPIDWIWMADQRDAWTEQWRRSVIGG